MEKEKILILKPSSLGDIVHGLQLVESIRQQKNVEITWVVRDSFADLLKNCKTVDKVIVFRRKAGIVGFFEVLRNIRKETYDTILDLQGLARTALWGFFAKGPLYGRSDAREGARFFYKKKAPLPQKKEPHALEILLEFLPLLGLKKQLAGKLSFSASTFPPFLRDSIILFPESRRKEKEWPHFVELTKKLLEKFPNTPIIWAGTHPKTDKEIQNKHFFNLLGQTQLKSLPDLILAGKCIVCNDSGPLHLAAAFKKHIVCLFGPTNPKKFGPYPINSQRHKVLSCKKLKDLQVKDVLDAISIDGDT